MDGRRKEGRNLCTEGRGRVLDSWEEQEIHTCHMYFNFQNGFFFFFLIIFKTDIEMYITFYFYLYIDILTKNRENIFLQL